MTFPRGNLANKWFSILKPFIKGGISGCIATTCIQPIDFVKVQVQLQNFEDSSKLNALSLARSTVYKNGILGLYKGLDAGLFRQLIYSTGRLGIYKLLCDYYKNQRIHQGYKTSNLPFRAKALIGLASGGIASFICNPTDLALIRLQTNSMLPENLQKNYKNVFQAMKFIIKQEGFFSMWKGSTPSIVRAMSINMGMLATYDQLIEVYLRISGSGEGIVFAKILSSIFSGAIASVVSLPFDIIKTQVQKQTIDEESKSLRTNDECHYSSNYTGIISHIYKNHGFKGFFRGYFTYYLRIAPHAMVTLLCMDWLNKKF